MSIEIRELKIIGFINKESKQHSRAGASQLTREDIDKLTKRIKVECVEEILEILERKNRR